MLALVTLACPDLEVALTSRPASLADRTRARRLLSAPLRARFAFRLGGRPRRALLPSIIASPPPGGGAGSSTAALVALARLWGKNAMPARLARACARAEGASDPLMFSHPDRLLFAPRLGRVIERLHPPPRCTILGGFLGPGRPTDPRDLNFADISDLLPRWRQATRHGDLRHVAALARCSAERTLALRGPCGDPTASLAARTGALGWTIAHTGSARGLIFAPGTVPPDARAALRDAGFTDLVQFETGQA